MEIKMKLKLSAYLVSLSSLFYGCTALTQPDTLLLSTDKEISNGTNIKDLPLSRDFILNNYTKSSLSPGNPKINSIKPQGTTKPRAVLLLDDNPLPFNWTVRKKNVVLCEGFMSLPSSDELVTYGKNIGDATLVNKDNHLITYMPALDKSSLPRRSGDCSTFITDGYDFINSKEEISYLLSKSKKLGKAPYLAVYESPLSPYSSMILSLGQLSPEAIKQLTKNWPELMIKVYTHGDNIDDLTIGIATMLKHDPILRKAQNDDHWKNIQIVVTGTACGGAIAASTVTLNTLLATPACVKFYNDAKDALGYS